MHGHVHPFTALNISVCIQIETDLGMTLINFFGFLFFFFTPEVKFLVLSA